MNNRLSWFVAPVVLGALLCLYSQPAMAQASGQDQGQQGEFNGENVDTGAAALDSGMEAAETPEAGELPEAGVDAKESLSAASAHNAIAGATEVETQDLNAEADFDLQEIMVGADVPGAN
jgi:hypothetical protein